MRKKILRQLLTIYKILVYITLLSAVLSSYVSGEDGIQLEPVTVTASRIYSEESDSRVRVRSQDLVLFGEEDRLSHFSVASVLSKFSSADTRTRGPYGVQADISLRGAPFEENLVLLDGVSLNDPKSGHHNMDLPLTLYDIERIDVTYGPASSVYGSGALGGALNIVSRSPEDKLRFSVSSSAGYWDFYRGGASLNVPLGRLKNRTSVEWSRSSGFAPETEFDTLTASSYNQVTFELAKLDIFAGYLTKKFGARSFYSDLYPDEEESVNTGLLVARAEIKRDGVSITPLLRWKRLQDKFILDRNRTNFSRNDHTTNLYGGEISSQVDTPIGNMAFGAEVGNEDISSTNLGEHNRVKNSLFLEYENRISGILLNTSARLDYYSTFGFQFSPSFNVGYKILPALALRAGAARAFRVPTFTELYYSSPANKGNPDLTPEEGWTYDAGFDYSVCGIMVSGTAFLRNTENIIDWTRKGASKVWQVENIGEFDMYGLESSLRLELAELLGKQRIPFGDCGISLKYSYLEGLDKKGITSKYVLEYLKHNLSLSVECALPFGFKEKINFSFKKRIGSEKYFLLDSTIYKNVKLKNGSANFFVKFSNILDTKYTEQGDIEMPGFAVFGGMDVRF
ncbi:MAG: hypothetical protein A2Z72_07500 [Omnitrophica bacterium RBG_13_46_9]|nr:MAG: hypothetical protein A2Z72_07500 [Omnitrophica bacterium RBG_13_46_9]